MSQFEAVTGRRPVYNYADMVNAEAPTAMQRYWNTKSRQEQQRQFEAQRKQQEDQQKAAETQSTISSGIGAVGLGKQIYDKFSTPTTPTAPSLTPTTAYSGPDMMGGGVDSMGFSTAPATTPTAPAMVDPVYPGTEAFAAADTASTAPVLSSAGGSGVAGGEFAGLSTAELGLEAGAGAGAEVGSSAGAGASSFGWQVPVIGAIIAAQQMMTNDTDTVVDGQRTGNFFSMSEDGDSWDPRPATEPWHGWANDKLGYDATSGEKLDASIQNDDWGLAAQRLGPAVMEWTDPVGGFAYDAVKSGVASMFNMKDQDADKVMAVVDPFHGIGKVAEDTYLCSQVRRARGLDDSEAKNLSVFRRFALENHTELTEYYMMYGPDLVMAIAAKEDPKEFYANLYQTMVKPVINMTRDGLLEDAYRLYERITLDLFEKYVPQLYPQEV
jgi:hypothetical protein